MSDNILVSIITVCYNSEKTIEQTIQSVLQQTYPYIEYLIIDGASTDKTMQIVNRYRTCFGERLKVVSEPDNGIYNAMNKGIRYSSGELIGIINSDDYYETDAVEKVVQTCKNAGRECAAVIYGELRCLIDDKEDSVSISSHHFLDRHSLGHPACFITRKAYDDCGVYDEGYKSVADYELFLRYRETGKVQFIPVYEILANFRRGGMCSTHKAYIELLRLQRQYHLISDRKYRTAKFKAELSKWIHG